MAETWDGYLRRTRSARGAVTEEQFDNSVEHLSSFASWAVWGAETYDRTIFEAGDLHLRLRKDVFLLGGNTGLFNGGRTASFSNFHTLGHGGDTKLKKAVVGTPLEGSYLSDIVKDYPTKGSGELLRDIEAGEVDVRAKVVDHLERELDLLGSPADTVVVLMGKGTSMVWDRVTAHPDFPASLAADLQIVRGIRHYTDACNFTEEIERALSTVRP